MITLFKLQVLGMVPRIARRYYQYSMITLTLRTRMILMWSLKLMYLMYLTLLTEPLPQIRLADVLHGIMHATSRRGMLLALLIVKKAFYERTVFFILLCFFLFLRPCTRTFLFFWVRTFTGSRYEVYEVAVTCTSCFMSSVGCLVCWRNTSLMTALGVDQCIVVLSSTSWGSVFHKVSYSWWGASDVFFREHDVIKSWPLLLSTRKGKSVTNTSRIFNFMCVCCSIIDEV
jgi:hypothetical protein